MLNCFGIFLFLNFAQNLFKTLIANMNGFGKKDKKTKKTNQNNLTLYRNINTFCPTIAFQDFLSSFLSLPLHN